MIKQLINKVLIGVEDKRQALKIRYPLREILLLSLCGVLCGCETYEEISDYGAENLEFLREYFEYSSGVPSDMTLSRIFVWLDPACLQSLLSEFLTAYFPDLSYKLIAIDGKTMRGSSDGFSKKTHNLSAFLSETKLTLSHICVDKKSNEIPEIPQLLEMISIENAVVTIDAMGCQRIISQKIIDKNAHYVLALKGNQGALYSDVKEKFPIMIANPKGSSPLPPDTIEACP